tara:strand:+ start:955 stop:1137 length:183 start_codon:yes stop_codon:yes gene_type:complete
MAMFTPRRQLRDMQQAAAAQALLNNRDSNDRLLQSFAASLLLGSPVQIVDDLDPECFMDQ